MIAIESILHIVYSKNTGIYSGFCMCHILKDEDEDIYVIHPLLQVGPGRGGDHIYIYISRVITHQSLSYIYMIYMVFYRKSDPKNIFFKKSQIAQSTCSLENVG